MLNKSNAVLLPILEKQNDSAVKNAVQDEKIISLSSAVEKLNVRMSKIERAIWGLVVATMMSGGATVINGASQTTPTEIRDVIKRNGTVFVDPTPNARSGEDRDKPGGQGNPRRNESKARGGEDRKGVGARLTPK